MFEFEDSGCDLEGFKVSLHYTSRNGKQNLQKHAVHKVIEKNKKENKYSTCMRITIDEEIILNLTKQYKSNI